MDNEAGEAENGKRETAADRVVQAIFERLQSGVVPWRRPFGATNLATGRPYSGMNALRLAAAPFSQPYWVSFHQAKELGGFVRRGEKGTEVLRPRSSQGGSQSPRLDGRASDEGAFSWDRFFSVRLFNIEQVEGISIALPSLVETDDHFETMAIDWLRRLGVDCIQSGSDAIYDKHRDQLIMPDNGLFENRVDYWRTCLHLMVHWTGHPARLDRPGFSLDFGGIHSPSEEELVAEIGTAVLASKAGFGRAVVQSTSQYIGAWQTFIQQDLSILARAAGAAQKAADWIIGGQTGT